MAWTVILSFVALSSILQLRQANAAAIQPPLLDCTSQIRLFLPHLFTHCSTVCQYSEWSDWQMVSGSTVNVPTTQCSSGEAYNGTRTRSSTAYDYSILGCTDTTQARQICKLFLHSIRYCACTWIIIIVYVSIPAQVCQIKLIA